MAEQEGIVFLRVPPHVKGRWVRESRAEGERLTDWLIKRIEKASISQQEIAQLCQVFGVSEAQLVSALMTLRDGKAP